ncbi:transcriptional regulator [Shinella sumterensis]|uniref:helix-turn-helix domain-containing protein n=1 Tax=Shinella sumterensis TaxID=1967501 RepID=UPI00106E9909|nr:helix-turn-helix transcriptional regulator [Shinella sumterensis]MCD1266699.1 helix-turn-helix domain-containing protein [Shinella sumterensis]TFE96692.1 transcriptional regulator [Shinella sumterensis]
MAKCGGSKRHAHMDVRVRVSRNIQRLRREKGLSQEDVAHAADVHQTYLSGVEGGKRNPSIDVLSRIAKALGVDISELFHKA